MKKILLIVGLVVLVLLAIGGGLVWYYMGKPLYEPGKIAAAVPLTPPAQSGDDWTVEPRVRLRHFEQGGGRRVVVVHGGPGVPFSGPLAALDPLADRFQFVYYDQRGCGRSSRPVDRFPSSNYFEIMKRLEATLGLTAQIADIERIRRILGEEKLTLIGHSFGAFLASLYAAEFPERVRALILVAPATVLVFPAEGGGLTGEIGRLLPAEMASEYANYLKAYFNFKDVFSKSESELAVLNYRFGDYFRVAAKAKGSAVPEDGGIGTQGGWMVQAMYFSMGKRHDYRAALAKVATPVLVLHGQNDIQPERASRVYSETFPKATFRIVRNAGHFPFIDQPAEFAAAVGEFLGRPN